MVNSKNEIVNAKDEIITDFPDFDRRKNEMLKILQYISDNTRKKLNIAYSYQKENYKEKVFIPFKEEISSSDKLAKEYIEFKNNGKTTIDIDVLKSIVRAKTQNGIKFYLLTLGCIFIERNYFDNEIISIEYLKPIPYHCFEKQIKQETLTSVKNEKYTLVSDVSYEVMFKNGTVKVYSEEISKLDTDIERIIKFLNKDKAKNSNKATDCLMQLSNKRKDFYAEYKDIKNMIIKTFPKSRGIIYDKDKSSIRTVLKRNNKPEMFITILIGGTQEKPCYIFRGKTAYNVDELRTLLIANEKEEEWFTQIINNFK